MDSEGQFWYNIWRLVAVSLVAITLSISMWDLCTSVVISDMVKAGSTPMEARCAVYGAGDHGGNTAICTIIAQSKLTK